MEDAIFVQGVWLAFFPALIIGMCLSSLIFLWIERRVITGSLALSFVALDLLWIVEGIRRLLILDQSDEILVMLDFLIVCFFSYLTLRVYRDRVRKNVLQHQSRQSERDLEKLKNWI